MKKIIILMFTIFVVIGFSSCGKTELQVVHKKLNKLEINKKEICKKISMCQKEADLIDDGEKWKICIHTPGPKNFPRGQMDCYFFNKKTLKQSGVEVTN